MNSRLLVSFGGVKIYMQIFDCIGRLVLTPVLFKGQLGVFAFFGGEDFNF